MFYCRVFELFRCFIIGYANTRSNFRREIECFPGKSLFKNSKKKIEKNSCFEFLNKDFPWLSMELTPDMGIIRKLSTWSSEKKSQKLKKSTFLKTILLSKAFKLEKPKLEPKLEFWNTIGFSVLISQSFLSLSAQACV